MKADRGYVSALAAAEQFARAAHFEVAHGNGITRAQLGVLGDHLEPFLPFERGRAVFVAEEVRVGALGAASHPSAQLVELRQAKGVGAVHDERVRVGDIQPRFDDGGAQQHIDLSGGELLHHARERAFLHLPVTDADTRFGQQLFQVHHHRRDGLHAVVEEENLSAAFEFAADRLLHQAGRVRSHVGDDGQALVGRGVDGGDVAYAGQRHVERAGDGCGGEREHIHFGAQLFEMLLVGHAEALLFIDDHQPEVFEADILADEAVGADDDIHLPEHEFADDLILFAGRAEAREHLNIGGEGLQALAEGLIMLLRQNGGGHEHGNLFAIHHRFEGGAQGNLGFAVAYIPAQEPVHGAGVLHIALHGSNGIHLVGRLHIGEAALELKLPGAVFGEGETLRHLALGVQVEQVLRNLFHRAANLALGVHPLLAAEAREGGALVAGADVAGEPVRLGDGDEELVAAVVIDGDKLAGDIVDGAPHEPLEDADAVIHVHHQVADLKVAILGFGRLHGVDLLAARLGFFPAEYLAVGVEEDGLAIFLVVNEAREQAAIHKFGLGEGHIHQVGALIPQFVQARALAGDDGLLKALAGGIEERIDEGRLASGKTLVRLEGICQRRGFAAGTETQIHGGVAADRILYLRPGQVGHGVAGGQIPCPDSFVAVAHRFLFDEGHGAFELGGIIQNDECSARQVIEQGRGERVQQRQVELGVRLSLHLGVRGERLEELARGGQQVFFERLDGALAGGVEELDGIDLVAEVIEPDGMVGGHGPDIEDAAAAGELPGFGNNLHRLVTERNQLLEQLLLRQAHPTGEARQRLEEVAARHRAGHHRLGGGENEWVALRIATR